MRQYGKADAQRQEHAHVFDGPVAAGQSHSFGGFSESYASFALLVGSFRLEEELPLARSVRHDVPVSCARIALSLLSDC
jgi:hypothetical protein